MQYLCKKLALLGGFPYQVDRVTVSCRVNPENLIGKGYPSKRVPGF